jgi:hypothetical protein
MALSVGGAVAETALLSWVAPGARALGPQVTALPPLAAYHDLRWLFAFGPSWPAFITMVGGVLAARSAVDAFLIQLAWPERGAEPRPRFVAAFWSCAVLTLLVWVVLSPVVTLMFGVALVPFSWPFLAAVPILLGTALALCHGGVGRSWWRRLPPASTIGWLLTCFVIMTAAAAVLPRLDAAEFLGVAALVGLVNARAWYGLAVTAVKHASVEAPQTWHWRAALWEARQALRRRTSWLPVAPAAAILVVVLVIVMARLTFTGTVHLAPTASNLVAGTVGVAAGTTWTSGTPGSAGTPGSSPGTTGSSAAAPGPASPPGAQAPARGSGGKVPPGRGGVLGGRPPRGVLVVGGFGSNCCRNGDALAAAEPGMLVRQFSYLGLNADGEPIPYHLAADLPIQELGDMMAVQVERLYAQTHTPVDIVAESEGTLGLYAMLVRHPGLPVGSLVLLSPIVAPGQVGQAGVPGAALITLNDLVGKMSPYGPAGAQALIDSVSQVGAAYFDDLARDRGLRWFAIVPLADAVTLPPSCPYPPQVAVVPAFHGGLLGNPQARQMVQEVLNGDSDIHSGLGLRRAAQVISAAASAWRMPDLHPLCLSG